MQHSRYPYYRVSNLGNVLDVRKHEAIEPILSSDGNVRVVLHTKTYKTEAVILGKLVYEAFRGVELGIHVEIEHLDGNPQNNVIGNLKAVARPMKTAFLRVEKPPSRIVNLDTGEVYESARSAAKNLGYATNLPIPPHVRAHGGVFKCRGTTLKLVR